MKISSRNIFTFQLNLMDPLFGVRKLTFAKQFAFFFGETHLTNSGFSSFPYPKPDPHELIASMFVVVNTGGWRTHVPPNMSSSNIMTSHRKTSKLTQKKKTSESSKLQCVPPPPCSNVLFWADKMSWDSWPKNDRHHAARLLLKRSGGAIHWNISTKKNGGGDNQLTTVLVTHGPGQVQIW